MNASYFDQVGLIPGQGYNRGSGFASIDHSGDRLRLGLTTNLSRILTNQGEGGAAYGYLFAVTPLGQPTNYMNPDSLGLYDPRPDDDPLNLNPLLEAQSVVRQQTVNRAFGAAYAEYQITNGLTYRVNFGPDYTQLTNGCWNGTWTHGNCSNLGAQFGNQGQPPQAGQFNQQDFTYTLDNLLHYNKTVLSQHHFDLTGLYSIQHDRFSKDSLYASNLPYPTQLWYDLGSGTAGNQRSLISEWSLKSYMGRVNYTFADRYTVSITERADGSSRLAPGHKWAYFPSFGASWQIGDEGFMRNFPAISALKLRGSFGSTGNTAIAPYATEGALSARLYTFGTTRVRGYKPGAIPNPDLGWEKTTQQDVGVEYGLFNDRLSGTIDVYKMKTHDLLLTRLLPATSGFTSTLQNIGSTENKGVELGITTIPVRNWRGLNWTMDVNWSTNKNKITALASGATSDAANVWFVGHPINLPGDQQRQVFYDFKYVGVWQYADTLEMKKFNAKGSTFKVGDPRVADLNGDYRISADSDRTFVGDTYPGWTASWSNRFTYKGFDLSGLITAKWNYVFIDQTPRSYKRSIQQRRGSRLLDADEPDEQEPGAHHRCRGPSLRGDTPLHRRLALAHSQYHRGLHLQPAIRESNRNAERSPLRHSAGSVHPLELHRHRSGSTRWRSNRENASHRLERRLLNKPHSLSIETTYEAHPAFYCDVGVDRRRCELCEPRRKIDHRREQPVLLHARRPQLGGHRLVRAAPRLLWPRTTHIAAASRHRYLDGRRPIRIEQQGLRFVRRRIQFDGCAAGQHVEPGLPGDQYAQRGTRPRAGGDGNFAGDEKQLVGRGALPSRAELLHPGPSVRRRNVERARETGRRRECRTRPGEGRLHSHHRGSRHRQRAASTHAGGFRPRDQGRGADAPLPGLSHPRLSRVLSRQAG
jgi:outer membrane receptor protein involved in Fe transport